MIVRSHMVVLALAAVGACGQQPGPSREPYDPSRVLYKGEPVATLLDTLRHGSVRDREYAAQHMHCVYMGYPYPMMESGRMGWGVKADEGCRMRAPVLLPYLFEALKDPEATVRLAAVNAIEAMSFHNGTARGPLAALANDPDERVRTAAEQALRYAAAK